MAQANAQLANAEAVQVRTQLDVDRYIPLAKEQAASQQDLDNATQNNLAAKATVATAKAQIKTAEAAVETARINLAFTTTGRSSLLRASWRRWGGSASPIGGRRIITRKATATSNGSIAA